jgi:heme/copper-type cytochrome/quinol oxidase subunit 4
MALMAWLLPPAWAVVVMVWGLALACFCIHYGICFMHKNSSSSNAVVVSAVGCLLRVVAHAFYVCVLHFSSIFCV